jgi:predicted kinase
MKKVILMRGLPGSGKSTYAKKLLAEQPGVYKRINRDELRMMFDNGAMTNKNEAFVKKVRDMLILEALNEGVNVIVDDTNLSEKTIAGVKALLQEYQMEKNDEIAVEVKEMEADVEECVIRDSKRETPVGEKVIKRMHRQFFHADPEYCQQDTSLPKAIICDLDGTIALLNKRNPFNASKCDKDLLNIPVATVIKNHIQLGYKIILLSGRQDNAREPTERWLNQHGFTYDQLLMRATKDMRKDSIIKKEIYHKFIEGKYFIEFVLDDRNQVVDMWRKELGLPCFQVYYGDF